MSEDGGMVISPRAARICLWVGMGFFLTGGFMLCHCPGWYLVAAGCSGVPARWGSGWVRMMALILLVFSVTVGVLEFQAERRLEKRLQEIRAVP